MGAKLKWGILGGVGVVLTILGFGLGFGAFPVIIRDQVEKNLNLFDNASEGRQNFEAPPVDVYMKFHVYHVLNPDEAQAGTEKPRVEERGPYAYREKRSKIHDDYSEESSFVIYGQEKTYHFDKNKSCSTCDKDDIVTVVNAPMVGLSYIFNLYNFPDSTAGKFNTAMVDGDFKNYNPESHKFETIHDEAWKDSLFMNVTVDGLIFNGVIPGGVKFLIDQKLTSFSMGLPYVIQGTNGAQWKLNETNNLINRNVAKTQYTYDHDAIIFNIPDEGEKGYIQEIGNNTVLGIGKDDVVSLEAKSSPESEDQMWIRGAGDNNGWFTFTNEKSGKVLTQEFGNITTIENPSTGFAALNTKNGSTHNEWYEVFSGANDTMENYLQINRWGPDRENLWTDLNKAGWWDVNGAYNGSNACNLLSGSDGQQFHPYVEDSDKLYIFQTDVCRSLFITYQDDIDIHGIKALRFVAPPIALQVNTTANIGFAMQIEEDVNWDECIQKSDNPEILNLTACFEDEKYNKDCKTPGECSCYDGTLDVSKCMENAPVIISSPHFYQSPEKLRLAIDNLSEADPELHETRIDIQPHTGMAIQLHKRLQFNVPVMNYPNFDAMSKINDTLMPLLWVDEGADIDQENIDKLKKMLITPMKILEAAKWTLIALGVLLALLGFFMFIKAS